jgi:hypothetical protein
MSETIEITEDDIESTDYDAIADQNAIDRGWNGSTYDWQ